MEPFEYLSVLISIILGLGITQLLSGFGRWLEQRNSFQAYAPSIGWAAFLLIVHVQTWWSMFGMRHWSTWNFLQFGIVLLQPSILFLLAILVFPGAHTRDDLRTNYFVQRRWFFGLLMLLLVVSISKDLIRAGQLPDPLNLAFHALFLIVGLAGFVSAREGLHRSLMFGGLALIGIYIVVLFGSLEV